MPITSEHAGRSYPPSAPYRVSRAKIAEFATAIGDHNPVYFSEEPVAPPTFAAVIAAQAWGDLFADRDLGLALHRTMHGDQSFEVTRPLREGDDVVATLTIERVRNRGSLDMVSIVVDLAVDGATAIAARSTLMHTREDSDA